MRKKGLIFVVSAPSGGGKTTICRKVLKKVKGLTPSVSATTRRARPGEKHKKDYHYLPENAFKKAIKDRKFLEWEKNFGYLYGTPKKNILDKIKKGEDVILSIDVKGAMNIKKKFPESILIFIKPPSFKELLRRLKSRNTDDDTEIKKRIKIAKRELRFSPKYDYVVVNKKLESAIARVASIIKKERKRKGG